MKKILFLFLILLGTFFNVFSNELHFKADTSGNFNLSTKFSSYTILRIEDSIKELGNGELLMLKCNNNFYYYHLKENSYLSQNYKLRTKSANGVVSKSVDELDFDGHFYQNTDLSSGNVFALSTFQEKYFIYIKDSVSDFYIEPLTHYISNAPINLYVRYNKGDAITPTVTCGDTSNPTVTPPVVELNGCFVTELAIACDYSMTQKYGTINNILFRTINTLNLVNVDYKMSNNLTDDINFKIVEHYIVLCDTCNPWPYTSNINSNLTNITANGPSLFSNSYDLAQYWFDYPAFGGGVIGLAWMNAVCTGYRYNAIMDFTSDYNSMRCLNSHEIGHNFSCAHDAQGATIMAPSMSGASAWSAQSITQIGNYLPTIGCLANCPPYQLCDTLGINNLSIIKDTINNKIVVKITPTNGVSYRARLYSYQTGLWTPFNNFVAPIDSTFFNVNINTCSAKFKVEIAPICPVNIVGLSKILVFDYQKAPVLSPLVTAAFSYSINSNSVNFSNTSSNATNAFWNFGNGQTSNLLNPSGIIYYTPGTFNVCLNAINNCIYNQTCQNITIAPQVKPFVSSVGKYNIVLFYPNGVNSGTVNLANISVSSTGQGYKNGTFSINGNYVTFTPIDSFRSGDEIHISSSSNVQNSSNTNYSSFAARKYIPITNPTFALFDTLDTGLTSSSPFSADFTYADFDKNGFEDIVIRQHDCYGCQTEMKIIFQTSSGVFNSPASYFHGYSHTGAVQTPDLNNDGYPDIVYSCNVPSAVLIWMNNGNGTFAIPTIYPVSVYCDGIKFADIDGDKDLDIVAISGLSVLANNYIDVLKNNGNGIFVTYSTINFYSLGSSPNLKDYDNDGDIDIIFTTYTAFGGIVNLHFYQNDGNGNFILTNSSPTYPADKYIHLIEDYNGDGYYDLMINEANTSMAFYEGNGNMTTTPLMTSLINNNHYNVLTGDIDGDSDFDLINLDLYNGSNWNIEPMKKKMNNGQGIFVSSNLGKAYHSRLYSNRMTDIDNDGDVDFAYFTQDNKLCIAYNENILPCVPSIFITASDDTVCNGQLINFSANASNTGSSPSYQWKVNGANVGTNSPSFTTSFLANNDIVTCELTSSANCAFPNTVVSNAVPIVIYCNPCLQPKVYFISSNTTNPITNVWRMDANGANRQSLFNDQYYRSALSLSDDGTKISYAKRLNPTNGGATGDSLWICTANSDGTGEVVHYLVPNYSTYEVRNTDFNSNNTGIIFNDYEGMVNRDGTIYYLDLNTNVSTPITSNPNNAKFGPVYSRSYNRIYYSELTSGWFAFPIPGRYMAPNGSNINSFSPAFVGNVMNTVANSFNESPNGKRVVWGEATNWNTPTQLFIADTNGTNVVNLGNTSTLNKELIWNPDGISLLLAQGNNLIHLDTFGNSISVISPTLNTDFNWINWGYVSTIQRDTIVQSICFGSSFLGYNSTGTYIDTFNSVNGCDSIRTLLLTVNPILSSTITQSICQGQSFLGYTISGTYIDSFVNQSGCDSIRILNLTVNPLPIINIASIPSNGSVCLGQSITLTANGANTYSWTGGISNGAAFTPLSTTTYTVTGTSAAGCSATSTTLVSVNPIPIISVTSIPANPTICLGQQVQLIANGANSYSWSPTSGLNQTTGSNVIASPASSTTYTITGTNANGCSASTTQTITINQLPAISISPVNANYCIGGSISLTASGATNYSWSPNAGLNQTTGSSVISNTSTTTTYTVTGTDANGCSNTASKTVTVNALPTLSVLPVNPTICLNQSINLTAGGASTYAWSPASGLNQTTGTTVTSSPTSTTTYTITGTDTNGCSNTISNTVAVNPLPTLSATPSSATLCIGDSVTLNINGASTYTWSPSAGLNQSTGSQVKASPMATTTYTITGTNANGCTNTQTISVTVNPLPVLFISPANPTICFSESITLTANGATSYTWTPNAGLNNTSSPIVIANPTATQIYTVTGTDANGCENTISTTLTVNPLPVLSLLPANPSICIGDAVNMSVNGASTYTWSPSGGLNTTVGNSVQANPTVTTSYQVIGTTSLGCKDSLVNTVTVNPLPILTASPISTTICQGESTNLTINGANTYAWTPGGSLNIAQGSSVTASPYLTTTYTIVGTDVNSCTSVAQILVNVNPSYNRFDTLELCQGMSYTFGSQTITTAGNYIHTFQTGLSCDSTVNLHVKVYDKPVSNFNLADHACVNEPVLIQNNWQSPQASYAWNVGDGILTGNTPSINVIWTIPGTKLVSLEVATQSPCIPELFVDTIQVHQAQANIIVSDADTFFCIYDQIKLQTPNINGYSYMWSPSLYFNSTSYIAEGVVKEPVTVKVYVKDKWGCEAEDSKYLNVQPCCNAYLPNSFTPNGDGLNDVFRIIGEGNYHILDFYVANRWGNIVFRTIDQNVGWDGKIQGVEQSIDTYYYFLKYECANGDKRVIKGDLTLLR
jgi:gliding motility-associated-like protein